MSRSTGGWGFTLGFPIVVSERAVGVVCVVYFEVVFVGLGGNCDDGFFGFASRAGGDGAVCMSGGVRVAGGAGSVEEGHYEEGARAFCSR